MQDKHKRHRYLMGIVQGTIHCATPEEIEEAAEWQKGQEKL